MFIKPYSGTDGYIFISYSHADSHLVFPVIQALQSEHYRVWFDEGIDPGTEWDENIAEHIQSCGFLIAFLSENYLNSENCKDELNYARDLNKQRLLIYLEDVLLPPGMAMRFNRLQSIYKNKYVDENDFYLKLYSVTQLSSCKDDVPYNNNIGNISDDVNCVERRAQGKALAAVLTALLQKVNGTSKDFLPPAVRKQNQSNNDEQLKPGNTADSYAFIESTVASFLQSCSGEDNKTLTNGIGKKRLMRRLGIPDGVKVYMAHDDSLLKNGENGFAIWETGISARSLWSNTDFVNWNELAANGSEISNSSNNGDCYFISGDGSEKTILYLSGRYELREKICKLLRQIQKTLNSGSR